MAVSYSLRGWGGVGWGVDTRHSLNNKLWWVLYITRSNKGFLLSRKNLSVLFLNRWNLIEWFFPFSPKDLRKPLRCISARRFWMSDTWMKETSSCDFPVKSLRATLIASEFAILEFSSLWPSVTKELWRREEEGRNTTVSATLHEYTLHVVLKGVFYMFLHRCSVSGSTLMWWLFVESMKAVLNFECSDKTTPIYSM